MKGELVQTSFGWMMIPEEQDITVHCGDIVSHDGEQYRVLSVISPSKPDAEWSLRLKQVEQTSP